MIGAAAVYDCKKPSGLIVHHLHEMAIVLQAGAVTVVERRARGAAGGALG